MSFVVVRYSVYLMFWDNRVILFCIPGPCVDKTGYLSFCAAIRKKGTCLLMTYNVRVLCGKSCGICGGKCVCM